MQKSDVGEDKGLSRVNITQAAEAFGVSKQALGELLRVHREEAPQRGEDGLFDFGELKRFYEAHSRIRTPQELKVRVLEEELRLKKVKADEAEAKVMARATFHDVVANLDIALEAIITELINDLAKTEAEKKKAQAKYENRFKWWRECIANLEEGRGRN